MKYGQPYSLKHITSTSNPSVMYALKVRTKNKFAKQEDMIFVEGQRECQRALNCGLLAKQFFVCDELMDTIEQDAWSQQLNQLEGLEVLKVQAKVYSHLALRGDSQGIVGLFSRKSLKPFPSAPVRFVALYNVEKPGNLGAIARTADGLGVEGIVLIDSTLNELHHNAVRSSIGALFSVPIQHMTSEGFIDFCHQQKAEILVASGDAKENLADFSMTNKHVIVLGSEAFGVEGFELELKKYKNIKTKRYKIPMHGIGDSYNVSVAAAISMYELMRQKTND